jgi:SAM-dependent methyltransferase
MSLRESVFAITGRIQRRIVPELRYSQTTYEEHLRRHARGATAWLELGCGHQLLPPWRAEAEATLVAECPLMVGIDYVLDSLQKNRTVPHLCQGDIRALPFADESFDLVTANMVVEHLDDPVTQFTEVARVLKPGGIFLFHTPNVLSYPAAVSRRLPDGVKRGLARVLEGREAEDVFHTYYRANTDEAVREVAAQSGLEVAAIDFTGTTPIFSVVPPVAALELLYIRRLMRDPARERFRQTLIVALRRPLD